MIQVLRGLAPISGQLLAKIPGFRTGTTWKQVTASILYGFWLLMVIGFGAATASDRFPRGGFVWMCLSSVAIFVLVGNIAGIRSKLPIRSTALQVVVWGIVACFGTAVLAMPIPETPAYKAYEAEQAVKREEARKVATAEKEARAKQQATAAETASIAATAVSVAASPGLGSTPPAEQSAVPAPVATPTAGAAPSQAVASGRVRVPVTRVVDGDTIKVMFEGKEESVRLIGVDTPETVHPTKPVQPYGPEASAFTKSRLGGQTVDLEFDVERRDHYGRLLAYVWIAGEHFNATLMKEGYGQLLTVPPNVKYVEQFRALQQEARTASRGLWGLPPDPAPAAAPAPAPAPKPAPAPQPVPPSPNGGHDHNAHMYQDHNCTDFKSSAEATAFMQRSVAAGYGDHRLDADHDGIACERNR